jgi:hypothetical protein
MTHAIGDPNHLGVHNDLVESVRAEAQRFGVDVILPDEAYLGDSGHVDDHNMIVAALQAIADAPAPGPSFPTTIDYLIIAGGGAGGGNTPDGSGVGGGGAGGYLEDTFSPEAGTVYPITVGAGGGPNAGANPPGADAQPSTAFGLTAIGGGRGRTVVGGPSWAGPWNGGSGGGQGGAGTPGQGHNATGPSGGGAGGGDGTGRTSSITGTPVTRAAGGAGAGSSAGASNGQGSGSNGSGGWTAAGGRGVVIVRQSAADELPTVLTGDPKVYIFPGYIAFEWNANGSIGWA